MKRSVLTMALCITLAGGPAVADENGAAEKKDQSQKKDHYFTVQAFYPISTNKSKEDSTWANFTVIYGQIGSVVGVDLSYIASVVRHDMKGVQGTAVFAYTGENLKGVAGSGVATLVKGNLSGVQMAGVVSITGREFRGFQVSGVANYAGDKMKGIQVSPVNIAGDTSGMQIGVVNVAGDVRGVQIGIVNISKQMNGVPIGLVNIAENGGVDIVAWGSSLMAANIGVRFRAGYVYTMLAAGGFNQENHNPVDETLATQFYLGVRIPAGRLYVDTDLGFMDIDNKDLYSEKGEKDMYVPLGRIMIGFHITERIALFAGGGAAYMIDEGQDFKEGRWEPHYLGGVALEF